MCYEETAFNASTMDVLLIQVDQGVSGVTKTGFKTRSRSRIEFQQHLTIKHVVSSDTINRNRIRK